MNSNRCVYHNIPVSPATPVYVNKVIARSIFLPKVSLPIHAVLHAVMEAIAIYYETERARVNYETERGRVNYETERGRVN